MFVVPPASDGLNGSGRRGTAPPFGPEVMLNVEDACTGFAGFADHGVNDARVV